VISLTDNFLSQLFTIADAGAKDAADWAIARSLYALTKATEEGQLNSPGSERLETQTLNEEEEEEEEGATHNEGSV
jgi:hypothetical protein